MKNRFLIILNLTGFLFINPLQADGILDTSLRSQWRPVVSAAGGVALTHNLGQSNTFLIQNPISEELYIYSPSNRTQMQGMFEVFLGAEHLVLTNWLLQAGLAYNQTGSYQAQGTFLQGADTSSTDQYTYKYNTVARALLAEAKLMRIYQDKFYPYLLVGLGGSFNKSSNFSTNVPPFLTFTRTYANNSSRSFAYNVGVGIDMNIAQHARLGLGYRFAGLGQANLGASTIDNTHVSGVLSQSNLYENEILLQLTYII